MTALKILVIAVLVAAAVLVRRRPVAGVLSLSMCVMAGALTGLFFPDEFARFGTFETRRLIVPITQFIMFGMGATLSLGDFRRALLSPRAIAITMLLQFTIMPLSGWALARVFGFGDTVAAGLVLLGACSGGVASNVMTFLARGNVALSVSMTACSTLMAPFATPLAMKLLAGRMVEVDMVVMMLSILKIVVIPIALGLLAHRLLRERAVVMDRVLPAASIAGICAAQVFVTAAAYASLIAVGLGLLAAAMLHNMTGYALGYTGARLFKMNEITARTVTFEVGLQNAGMAIGLASAVFAESPDTALAAVVFSVWMNISGAALAAFWRDRRVQDEVVG